MAHAAAAEPAMVVALKHADVAHAAVVGARGAVTQTALAVRPISVLRDAERRQIADNSGTNHLVDVRQRVGVQEQGKYNMSNPPRGDSAVFFGVIVLHYVTGFVPQS